MHIYPIRLFGIGVALVVLGLLSLVSVSKPSVQGQLDCTVTVQPGQSIQSAINGAKEGAVICLTAGTWEENLVVIGKSIALRGAGRGQTKIKGKKENKDIIKIVGDYEIEVRIEDLTIAEAKMIASGIRVSGKAKVALINSQLLNNMVLNVGLIMEGSVQVTITSCQISGSGYGILMWNSAQATILTSQFTGNLGGIHMEDSAQATITDSQFSGNRFRGIEIGGSAQATIQHTTISGNGSDGIEMLDSAQATIEGNKIVNNGRYGVACLQEPCFDTDKKFEGAVRGSSNEISGNKNADVCPKELEFLKTEAGGCYGPKCS